MSRENIFNFIYNGIKNQAKQDGSNSDFDNCKYDLIDNPKMKDKKLWLSLKYPKELLRFVSDTVHQAIRPFVSSSNSNNQTTKMVLKYRQKSNELILDGIELPLSDIEKIIILHICQGKDHEKITKQNVLRINKKIKSCCNITLIPRKPTKNLYKLNSKIETQAVME